MSENFVNALVDESKWTKTANGAHATNTTNNSLVDLFGTIGALRTRSSNEVERLFGAAFAEDKLLAMKMSFYARNIRGGLGERQTPRVIWNFIARANPELMKKNLENVFKFGRFDDLYIFIGTTVESEMWNVIKKQLFADMENLKAGEPISLLAKWLKSANASSKETRELGRKTAKALNMTIESYRKILSQMRAYIDVTEVKMTAKEWDKINYSGVPSKAMNNYRKAFDKNDGARFTTFIEKVVSGEEKINASTLFPYDLTEKYMSRTRAVDPVLEAQWNALPNYIEGENNILVMADVSGSMSGRPMATSVGLAIYFAERNQGIFKNLYMTFHDHPKLIQVKGDTLFEKVNYVMRTGVGYSTNLEAAFKLVLNAAIEGNLSQDAMPKSIVVISDMEINCCSDVNRWTFYDSMKAKFAASGYTIPNIVFWNVNSGRDTFHAFSDYKGVQLLSGQSPSQFKTLVANIGLTPYEAMFNTLSDPMYDCVTL